MSITDTRKVCFVIMGFGKKTDYESGRTLDLDATYEAIIKPAAEENSLRCIRADEVIHSGLIDTPMYEMLLRADLVVADISTGNVNAVYELGVRHALRSHCTIIMKEAAGRLHFDLNHVSTFHYDHLGEDIGAREARRACRDLSEKIRVILGTPVTDSPVYTYLPRLQQPRLSEEEYRELLDEAEAEGERLGGLLQTGQSAMKSDAFSAAVVAFQAAEMMRPDEPFILQQLALATYKSKQPSEIEALITARSIIERLSPEASNDPETLGINGAIRKQLWNVLSDRVQLDAAIRSYGRGFEVRRDYYNGENLATCLDTRARQQSDLDEAQFDRMSARKTREALAIVLDEVISSTSFVDRSDQKWVRATRANVAFALQDSDKGCLNEREFYAQNPVKWEADTYEAGKAAALNKTLSVAPEAELAPNISPPP